ncbi:HD domain-containing protein [Candidatus Saccharibacteria bacterium]|nr:HD domain-containing protein [Candidatus Saccharibacteria bacterium]
MESLNCLNLQKLVAFFDENSEILHKSRYHREGFETHCLLVIGNMLEQYEAGKVSEEALVAACLHDIAKPRTAALNKRHEACFYGHENVTVEEVTEFLDPDYSGFDKVLGLIRGHMLPLGIKENTPEPFRSRNQERLRDLLDQYDEQFEKDLMILSDCDNRASVKSDDDLPSAEAKAELIGKKLLR